MNDDRERGGVAARPWDEGDGAVLTELRETVTRLDPCPAGLTERIAYALTVRALHAEVAELTRAPLALTRADDDDEPDQATTVTFSTDSVSIMVTVTAERDGTARVDGWLTCDVDEIELARPDGRSEWVPVHDGRFVLASVSCGPAYLVVRPPGGRTVVTPTFTL
ncbi:carboxypeptidase regulatory-like domain-containing protein [uncultured Serinicoccus sp.]|uniref:carboxypeptidase regulatory-like domain-containing protein n=1 Tax=uncultured Serinicoccus sp. TaxID=735514 RepID=UPI00262120DA|nr:carboxypeptidase regulatory-like domain-containing protein [uncultured Serinicoccus sp.]